MTDSTHPVGYSLNDEPVRPSEVVQIAEWNAMLNRCTNEQLVMIATDRWSNEQAERFEMLVREEKDEGLSPVEQRELDHLAATSERMNYLKSRAVALLRQRGCDISTVLSGA